MHSEMGPMRQTPIQRTVLHDFNQMTRMNERINILLEKLYSTQTNKRVYAYILFE